MKSVKSAKNEASLLTQTFLSSKKEINFSENDVASKYELCIVFPSEKGNFSVKGKCCIAEQSRAEQSSAVQSRVEQSKAV